MQEESAAFWTSPSLFSALFFCLNLATIRRVAVQWGPYLIYFLLIFMSQNSGFQGKVGSLPYFVWNLTLGFIAERNFITFPIIISPHATEIFLYHLALRSCVYSVAKSCPTVWEPMTVAGQAPLSMGYSREEYWSELPFPSQGDFTASGMETGSLASHAMANQILYQWARCEAQPLSSFSSQEFAETSKQPKTNKKKKFVFQTISFFIVQEFILLKTASLNQKVYKM